VTIEPGLYFIPALLRALLARHAAHLSDADRRLVLRDNVAELYGLPA